MALPVPDDLHPTAGVRVRRRRRLHLIAAQHGGCFTIAHTREAGYDRRARHHHLSYGNWRRTDAPGVYRLTGWPIDPAEPYHAWLLWAGAGAELTSWSALDVSGVLDVLPGPLTVVTPGEAHPRAERTPVPLCTWCDRARPAAAVTGCRRRTPHSSGCTSPGTPRSHRS